MGKIMLINASPRAPRSNSKKFAAIFSNYYDSQTQYREIRKNNHKELCLEIQNYKDIVFIFPLYADCLPVTLLNFLKELETNPPHNKPVVSVIINCGFLEPEQNNVAVEILQYYCRTHKFPFGSVLKIGSGEAILDTPFRKFLERKMKKFSDAVASGKHDIFQVTMPIPKNLFVRASSGYWENCGKGNDITIEEMKTMTIE